MGTQGHLSRLKDFLGSEILAKGIFWFNERCQDLFGSHKQTQGLHKFFYQLTSTITYQVSAIYCWCGIILGMLKHNLGQINLF